MIKTHPAEASLFEDYQPSTRTQEVDQVSRSNYHQMDESGELQNNEREVLSALARYWIARKEWPTGKELASYMSRCCRISSVLQIRPRLTELTKKKGYVEKGEIRNRERVWKLTDTGKIAAGFLERILK